MCTANSFVRLNQDVKQQKNEHSSLKHRQPTPPQRSDGAFCSGHDHRGGWHSRGKASSRAAQEPQNAAPPPKIMSERRLEVPSWTSTRVINTVKGVPAAGFCGHRARQKRRGAWSRAWLARCRRGRSIAQKLSKTAFRLFR